MCSDTVFHGFLPNYGFLRKNCWIKKIFGILFVIINEVIFIFGVRWLLTCLTANQWPNCKQSTGSLQPLLLRSKRSLFWRTSCVRFVFGRVYTLGKVAFLPPLNTNKKARFAYDHVVISTTNLPTFDNNFEYPDLGFPKYYLSAKF